MTLGRPKNSVRPLHQKEFSNPNGNELARDAKERNDLIAASNQDNANQNSDQFLPASDIESMFDIELDKINNKKQ